MAAKELTNPKTIEATPGSSNWQPGIGNGVPEKYRRLCERDDHYQRTNQRAHIPGVLEFDPDGRGYRAKPPRRWGLVRLFYRRFLSFDQPAALRTNCLAGLSPSESNVSMLSGGGGGISISTAKAASAAR